MNLVSAVCRPAGHKIIFEMDAKRNKPQGLAESGEKMVPRLRPNLRYICKKITLNSSVYNILQIYLDIIFSHKGSSPLFENKKSIPVRNGLKYKIFNKNKVAFISPCK
jgi:hypothetical protein